MKLTILKAYGLVLLSALALASCQKRSGTELEASGSKALDGIVLPVPPYQWTSLPVPNKGLSYPTNNPKIQTFTAPVGDTWYCFAGDCLEKVYKLNTSTKHWVQQPGYGSNFCLFDDTRYFYTYQSKLYYGLAGYDEGLFASFDPVSGVRTTLARFPGTDSIGVPVTFVLGDNGYLFFDGGYGAFWRYHFASNQWTNMGRSPLGKRHDAVVFVVGDKAYSGLGWETATSNGQSFRSYKKTWMQFTPGSEWQAVKAPFPGEIRGRARGFVIGDNIFVGFGNFYNANNDPVTTRHKDLWKYNITGNSWSRLPDFPGTWEPGKSSQYGNLAAFSQGNAGYVITGGLNEFWRIGNTPLVLPQ